MKSLKEAVLDFYIEQDAQNGYIMTKNRQGIVEKFPLLSLSVAGVSVWHKRFPMSLHYRPKQAASKKNAR